MWEVKTMKCVNCGGKAEEGKSLRPKCLGIENHTCGSFMQKTGEMDGVCQNAILCEPMKRALQGQSLIDPQLGRVICPYPSVNISFLRHLKSDRKLRESNIRNT